MRRRILLLAGAAGLVTGCGFELRRAPEFKFRTIAFVGFAPSSTTLATLKRGIASSETTHVVEAVTQAEVVLQALTDARERTVATTTSDGQVRDINLVARFIFELHTPAGKQLIGSTELALARDMTYNETDALAKEQEDALVFKALQEDLAQQTIRRLAAVKAI